MHGFNNIVTLFFRVALFKTPPQELPASDKVLFVAIALSLLVGLLRYFIAGAEYYSIARVVLELLVPGVLIYLLLKVFKLPSRFAQTFAAVCGSGAIIYALALPVFPSFHAAADESQYGLSVYIIILLDLWSVAVLAFILKHAVNVGFATGISLAVAVVLLTLVLVESISPSRVPDRDVDQLSFNSIVPRARLRQSHGFKASLGTARFGPSRFGLQGGTKFDSIAPALPTLNANPQGFVRYVGTSLHVKGVI